MLGGCTMVQPPFCIPNTPAPKMARLGLTQIYLIIQIYYFSQLFLRFLREPPHPLANGAENLRNPINLCETIT